MLFHLVQDKASLRILTIFVFLVIAGLSGGLVILRWNLDSSVRLAVEDGAIVITKKAWPWGSSIERFSVAKSFFRVLKTWQGRLFDSDLEHSGLGMRVLELHYSNGRRAVFRGMTRHQCEQVTQKMTTLGITVTDESI